MKKGNIFSPFKAIRHLFRKPKTLKYPFEPKEPARRYRGFHLNDWDACTGCGNCADICPNGAIIMVEIPEIKPEPGKKNQRPKLDYGRCCFCGLCVDICPPGALSLTGDYFHIHFDTKTFSFIPGDEKSDPEHFVDPQNYSLLKASLSHRKKNFPGFSPDIEYALFEPERVPMPQVEPEERSLSFIEQVLGYSEKEARAEAARCLECKLCEEACPAHLKISDYIKAIYLGEPEESLRKIYEDNPIPAICGRICMKHCEAACSLSVRGEALSIRWLKRFVADTVRDYQKALQQKPAPSTGKKLAIIGAGPGGLSMAYFSALKGHHVTVFDSLPGGGGMLRVGPPLYRLPIEAIDKDVNYIKSLGVEFRFNATVGKNISFGDILKQYDAVYLGIGMTMSRSTKVRNSEKCILALNFLERNKIREKVNVGKKVVVIGGGNVAMDVARESIRLQHIQHPGEEVVTSAVSLEDWDIMPANKEEIEEAKEEGIRFNPAWGPKDVLLDDKGNIRGLLCMKVKRVFDDAGRFSPTFYEDQEMILEADTIIEAIGQASDFSFIPKEMFDQLKFTPRRKIQVDEYGMTSLPGVFAGGDIVNTNLDAVTAIADAKIATEGVDHYLSAIPIS
ncbi:FAD-dependent oxidoreductase [Candidatus Sumerlaeota bacterium]|nr:FAD-dependent oxidoreductase [Candidatus Sumerlaeota bacterium]